MGRYARERATARVARAAGHGLDLVSFWREAGDAIAAVVPHHLAPCWFTSTPASLLVTSHWSPAWNRYIHPYGGDQELMVALRTRSGEAWGVLTLYREPDRPVFDAEEIGFLRELSPYLAEGAAGRCS